MKVVICGSMTFSKEMLEIADALKNMGHEPIIPSTVDDCLKDPTLNMNLEFCSVRNVMREHFNKIEDGDAVLVLNYDKNNVKGYIGASSLMEMGLAYHLNKKIFLLNDIPNVRHGHEIQLMNPVILNGDIKKIGD